MREIEQRSNKVCYGSDQQLFQGFVTAFDLVALIAIGVHFSSVLFAIKHNQNVPAGLSQQDSRRTALWNHCRPCKVSECTLWALEIALHTRNDAKTSSAEFAPSQSR